MIWDVLKLLILNNTAAYDDGVLSGNGFGYLPELVPPEKSKGINYTLFGVEKYPM